MNPQNRPRTSHGRSHRRGKSSWQRSASLGARLVSEKTRRQIPSWSFYADDSCSVGAAVLSASALWQQADPGPGQPFSSRAAWCDYLFAKDPFSPP